MKIIGQQIVTSEMRRLMNESPVMGMEMTPFEWVTTIGFCQLAMRHDGVEASAKETVMSAMARVQAMMAEVSEPIGQMIETGWHESFDTKVVPRKPKQESVRVDVALEGNAGSIIHGAITLDGDGAAILDVMYAMPGDPDSERWQYDMLMYGIGDELFICHVFWSAPFSLREVYRICLGLLNQMEPLSAEDAKWLEGR